MSALEKLRAQVVKDMEDMKTELRTNARWHWTGHIDGEITYADKVVYLIDAALKTQAEEDAELVKKLNDVMFYTLPGHHFSDTGTNLLKEVIDALDTRSADKKEESAKP